MLTKTRIKWGLSFIVGGIVLALALMGGKWQFSYAADGGVNADPHIDHITPSAVPAGSGNVMLIISGANFGESEDFIRIWIKDAEHDYRAAPVSVFGTTSISVVITDTLLVEPNLYSIAVVQSNGYSIPPIPPDPEYDKESNFVDFVVFPLKYQYLPILIKQ
jgi:hypothetical protein